MQFFKNLFSTLVALFALLISWHLLALWAATPVLPTPLAAISIFFKLLPGEISTHFIISFYRIVVSLALAFIIAVPLGLAMGQNKVLDSILSPITFLLYPIPKIVFLPLLVIFLGLGNAPKIFLIFLIVFFQILVTARDASKDVAKQHITSMVSLGASTWQVYRHVIWPASLPQILTALRISTGTAIAVLFLAETFASTEGLGSFILSAMSKQDYPEMFAGIIAMALLGLISYFAVDIVEKKYCSWMHF